MLELPIIAWPNQSFLVQLGERDCTVNLYQRGRGAYLDLLVGGEPVCQGSICQPGIGIIQNASSLFSGQLVLLDTLSDPQMQASPDWREFGSRFRLYWLDAAEAEAIRAEHAREALDG